jgi:hypothetical protein
MYDVRDGNAALVKSKHRGWAILSSPTNPKKGIVMWMRIFWTAILVATMIVSVHWIDATLEYAAPMHIMAIASLAVIAVIALMQVVGITFVTQKWIDEVEIVDEEDLGEAAEWSPSDELKDIRELVEWKATQMASIEDHTIERLDDLQAQINKHDSRIKELQDNAGLGELDEDE